MTKRGRNQTKDHTNLKRVSRRENVDPRDLDDEIDTFHKQRDIIPLDINNDDRESSEDEEVPVFDDEDINEDEDDDNEEEEEDDDDDDVDDSEEDDSNAARLATKIKRQQKYIKEKFAIVDDATHDEEEEYGDEKEVWGGKKEHYYGDDKRDSSDEEEHKEEEEEILRMQWEKAKKMWDEDFGLQNVSEESKDESGRELAFKEISKAKSKAKGSLIEEVEKMDTFEVKKDLNSLSREEQMDVVYSSAPELVYLLSELNDALEQLESRVNPLLSKVKNGGIVLKGGIRYLEAKQLLLLTYCQAITFYLLLRSEGQSVRDHPVIARLVEIKSLLDKMKQLDGSLPSEIEELLKKNFGDKAMENKVNGNNEPESVRKDYSSSHISSKADMQEPTEPSITNKLLKTESSGDHGNKEKKKRKLKTDQVGFQSAEMFKLRAALEEKLKQKGVFSSLTPNIDRAKKHSKSVNEQLESYDDFNDDAVDAVKGYHGLSNGHTSLVGSAKLSQLVSAKTKKPKVVSGDDDLPKRDDIGERRRKHELRVLTGAGVVSEEGNSGQELETDDDASNMEEDSDAGDSEADFYREVKQKRDAKLAAKTAMYTRNPTVPTLPETVEGKRHINYQIEKNRGLTRSRRKDLKNPRKKYRTKHDKQKKSRSGQVQEMRKQGGSYPGEQTGINARISRSIRF